MNTATAFALCAAIGAVARAEIGHRLNRDAFPWGTLVINASGSLALGLLATVSEPLITVVGVAGLGAYTTFSSFARDVAALVEQRHAVRACGYIAATLVACVAGAWLGIAVVS